MFVSADVLALVAALLVAPAAPAAGSVVVALSVPPLHPANSRANATHAAKISSFGDALFSPFTFIKLSFRFDLFKGPLVRPFPPVVG